MRLLIPLLWWRNTTGRSWFYGQSTGCSDCYVIQADIRTFGDSISNLSMARWSYIYSPYYVPTETNTDASKDAFYDQLQIALDLTLKKGFIYIFAGDFSTHFGADKTRQEGIIGWFGYRTLNDNGLWCDRISDHYLVRARIRLRLQRAKKLFQPSVKRDWSHLRDPEVGREFQIALSNRFEALTQLDDITKNKCNYQLSWSTVPSHTAYPSITGYSHGSLVIA